MASIIALQGPANAGKSETLIALFHALKEKYPEATVTELHRGTRDITVVLRGIDGKIVGIESQGDPGSRLKKSLADLLAAGCDVIFCACRTSGMTVDWLSAYARTHHVRFLTKSRTSRAHTVANEADVATLMRAADL